MITLSESEKREMLEDAASDERRSDFARMVSNPAELSHSDYLEFLTWASSLSTEDAGNRKRPIEKVMLL